MIPEAGNPLPRAALTNRQRAGRLWSALLDSTILYSFDRTGFRRHQRDFRPGDLDVDMKGKVCLVTGANSGLGLAAAAELARRRAEVWLLCRNRERAGRAQAEIERQTGSRDVRVAIVDLSVKRSILDFAREFSGTRVDVLVNNAGVLPDARIETEDGLELTLATNLVGPFLLTWKLVPRLAESRDARVINVSSGGMYTQRLDLKDIQWRQRAFDGVIAYARTKRALVILTDLWAMRMRKSSVCFNSLHPGWADTPAVRTSLPTFWRWMRGRLRSPAEGADTMVWLAVCERLAGETGKFWFDRRAARTHLAPWTRERRRDRERLWDLCCELAGVKGEVVGQMGRPDE